MQTRAVEILVGIFICLGVAAIFILTLRVSNFNETGASGYTLTASFQDVGGLKSGAPVEMAGVTIGRVGQIKLNAKTFDAVARLKIEDKYKIPKGSSASILTSGLLGSQYVGISPGGSLDNMQNGDSFDITQSALVLEHLIGQFVSRMGGGSNDSSDQSSGGSSNNPKASKSPAPGSN